MSLRVTLVPMFPPIAQFQTARPGPFLPIPRTYLLGWLKPEVSQSNKWDSSSWQITPVRDAAIWGVEWPSRVCRVKPSTARLRLGTGTVGLAFDASGPAEDSTQDSVPDGYSKKHCVKRQGCPPRYCACFPSRPRSYLCANWLHLPSSPTRGPRRRYVHRHTDNLVIKARELRGKR